MFMWKRFKELEEEVKKLRGRINSFTEERWENRWVVYYSHSFAAPRVFKIMPYGSTEEDAQKLSISLRDPHFPTFYENKPCVVEVFNKEIVRVK